MDTWARPQVASARIMHEVNPIFKLLLGGMYQDLVIVFNEPSSGRAERPLIDNWVHSCRAQKPSSTKLVVFGLQFLVFKYITLIAQSLRGSLQAKHVLSFVCTAI